MIFFSLEFDRVSEWSSAVLVVTSAQYIIKRLHVSSHDIRWAETQIVDFIAWIKDKYPRFYLVSHNIVKNMYLLNDILHRHQIRSINHRGNGIYLQPICMRSLGVNCDTVSDPLHNIQRYICLLHKRKGGCFKELQVQDNNKPVVSVDVECFNEGEWQSIALITYVPGKDIHVFKTSCRRSEPLVGTQTWKFWKKHQGAYTINYQNGTMRTPEEAERLVTQYITTLQEKYQSLTLISDNPSFDLCILHDILNRNGLQDFVPSSDYLCTWSRSITNRQYTKKKIPYIDGLPHTPVVDAMHVIMTYVYNRLLQPIIKS